MAAGVILGLLAALFHALCYLATRWYVHRRGGGSRRLLVIGHLWMGGASLALLPLVWPAAGISHWGDVLEALVLTSVFYLAGQLGLVIALKHAEASRISPMLAFKLVVLAALATLWPATGGGPLSAWQWSAVGLCVVGGLLLNHAGGTSHPKAVVGLALACVAYALSDWNIKRLVNALGAVDHMGTGSGVLSWRTPLLAVFLTYCFCGICAVGFLPWLGSRKRADWLDAAPFAVAWLGAMIFLYGCFATVGLVMGSILQSTRGIMSVLLAGLLVRWGHHHIEGKTKRGVFWRRLAAAALMLLAMGLYMHATGRR